MPKPPPGTRETAAAVVLIVFFLTGGLWVGLGFLPDGIWRDATVIVMALVLVAAFFWLLSTRLVRLFAGRGSYTLEACLALANVLLLLAAFAALYAQYGLTDTTSEPEQTTHRYADAAYYSVVTFTTLGYGDLQPKGVPRVLACIETFVGYIVLGLLASTASTFVQAAAQAKLRDDDESVTPAKA